MCIMSFVSKHNPKIVMFLCLQQCVSCRLCLSIIPNFFWFHFQKAVSLFSVSKGLQERRGIFNMYLKHIITHVLCVYEKRSFSLSFFMKILRKTIGKFDNIRHAHPYLLGDTVLEHVFTEKDVGLIYDSNLSFEEHILAQVRKAYSMVGLTKRSLPPVSFIIPPTVHCFCKASPGVCKSCLVTKIGQTLKVVRRCPETNHTDIRSVQEPSVHTSTRADRKSDSGI